MAATDQVMVTFQIEEVGDVVDIDMEVDKIKKPDVPAIGNLILAPPTIVTLSPSPTPRRRWEFQPPSMSISAPSSTSTSALSPSFLGADLSSSLMAPPKLNTVKKSRILVNPGKSMVEWMKIQQELCAKGPKVKLRKIGPDELATHNTLGDVWMAINDRVFDISDYSSYHPGGVEEIMKGAGQDGTTLFNQIHRWVNFESILKGNLLGYLVPYPTLALVRKSSNPALITAGFSSLPSTTFSEDDESVFLEIDSHMVGDIRQESWTVGVLNRERLVLKVMIQPPKVWTTHLKLMKALADDQFDINYKNDFKRILITLKKPQQEHWLKLGSPLPDHNQLLDSRTAVEDFYPSKLIRKEKLSRNTYLFTATTQSAVIGVPIGFHVQIRLNQNVSRPFTPVILSMTGGDDGDDADSNCSSITQNSQELHFIIKIYPDGQFTSLLQTMFTSGSGDAETLSVDVEAEIEMGFARGHFDPSFFHNAQTLILIAGGTGITPFIRIIQYLYRRRMSIPVQKVVLLFFNETSQDVIWNEEWDALSAKEPSWFHFYPVISKPTEDWRGRTGRISSKLFEDCATNSMSASGMSGESKAMICGSLGFNAACKQVLKEQEILNIDDPGGIFIFNG